MTPTKGDVKHWLKAIGKNRDWLAMEMRYGKRYGE